MSRNLIRAFFCLAVAILAAVAADILVEFASNSGWFGSGSFTDHSNLDVAPSASIGVCAVLVHCVLRLRERLRRMPAQQSGWVARSSRALGHRVARLLPLIFGLQIGVLYVMECSEQLFVAGHLLGGTIWLGGPVAIALLVHALACVLLTIGIAGSLRILARGTIELIRFLRILSTIPSHGPLPTFRRNLARNARFASALALRSLAERAPPFVQA